MRTLLRHAQDHLTAAFRTGPSDFLLSLHVSALLDRGNHLRQLGAVDQCNRTRFGELPGFRGKLAIRDHDPVLHVLGRHHTEKLTYDLNTLIQNAAIPSNHPSPILVDQTDEMISSMLK